jgi:glycosyltransferase involved in cell wall biosynthesis
MGEGPNQHLIESLIQKHNLADFVKLLPYQKNPFGIVRKARFTILTSHFEGFPLSLAESLANATPVVAVDCESARAKSFKMNRMAYWFPITMLMHSPKR